MSAPEAIYFLAILFVGLPAAFRLNGRIRNVSAFAMVATWFLGRAIYTLTGEGMPIQAMLVQDFAVIAVIFAKHDWQDCSPYRTVRAQLAALWLERSPWDRIILALFAPAWLFYAPILNPYLQYWTLYGIGLAQLALAGHEAFFLWQRAAGQKSRADAPGTPPPRSLFAPVSGEAYG